MQVGRTLSRSVPFDNAQGTKSMECVYASFAWNAYGRQLKGIFVLIVFTPGGHTITSITCTCIVKNFVKQEVAM